MKPEVAFGKILKLYRNRISISQENLASESGLDRTYISLLERGLRQPSLTSILHIAEALKVSPEELVQKTRELLEKNTHDC